MTLNHEEDMFEFEVIRLLDDGHGVEDIAVKLECDIKVVREIVRDLRESGFFG